MKGLEKKSDRYFIYIEDKDRPYHMKFRRIKGEQVNLPYIEDAFVHMTTEGHGYAVSEGITGDSLSGGNWYYSTKEEAIQAARKNVRKHISSRKQAEEFIAYKLSTHQASPRYQRAA